MEIHGPTAYCGIFVEIIRKFGRKSSSIVWNLMYNSDKRIQ